MQPRFWLWRLPASFRPPAVVWALSVLAFFLSVSASLVLPTYLGYDEPQHVDMVASVAYGDGWPGPGDRHIALGIARSANYYYGPQLKVRPLQKGLTQVAPRGQRPSLNGLGGDASAGGLPNQIVQHPPLYYAGEAVVVRLLGALDWPYDKLVGLLRILTALLCAPLPILVWGIANRLRTSSCRRRRGSPVRRGAGSQPRHRPREQRRHAYPEHHSTAPRPHLRRHR